MKSSEIRKILSFWELLNDSNQDEIAMDREDVGFNRQNVDIPNDEEEIIKII